MALVGTRLGSYEIVSLIGSGGMGEVYRARDTKLARDVAIKLLPATFDTDPERLRRFELEARAASALNHPHIVTIYEAGKFESRHFIVMELVRGRTLRRFIGSNVSVEMLRDIALQIAKALAAAHESRIVHRDIKPDNIMVRDDGYVKILDFGLARLKPLVTESAALTVHDTSNIRVGTARYMSPEQALVGDPVDTPTDIFSLGVVLYELATLRHPFEARSSYSVLHAIINDRPVPPERLNAELPHDFAATILRMMQKDARARPTALEVVAALAAPVGSTTFPTTSGQGRKRRTVGREREFTALQEAFDHAGGGRGLMVCVTGEPGIGKSALVEEFLGGLEESAVECRVARGRCSERLAGAEAYLPLLDALESLLRGPDGAALARVMKTVSPLWYAQVSASSGTDSSGVNVAAPIPTGAQERLKRELAAFLEEAAQVRPLVFFFDDVHWVDVSTVDLISYLASRFETMALLIVVTYRREEMLRQKHPFLRIQQDLQARASCRELALEFLTVDDVRAYVNLEFGEHQLPGTFIDLIHAKTEGSPLFVVDVLQYLRARKVITKKEDGCWRLHEAVPDIAETLPQSVHSMIQRKIDLLDETDRRLLTAASVQGYEFDTALLSRVAAIDPIEVEERLDLLDRVHAFVRVLGEHEFPDRTLSLRCRFVHVLYQNFLYSSLTPARRIALSKAVAAALEAVYADRIVEAASELAVLYEASREFSRAAHHFLTAAQHAARVFAYQEALLLAERGLKALEATPPDVGRKRQELGLLLAMGVPVMSAYGQGHPRMEQLYSRARMLCMELDDTSELPRILWGLWRFNMIGLNLEHAYEAAVRLLDAAEKSGDPSLLVQAHLALGQIAYHRGEFLIAQEYFDRVITLYDRRVHGEQAPIYGYDPCTGARAYRACLYWILGTPDRALEEVQAALRLARELNYAPTLAYALFFVVVVHQFRHEWESARHFSGELAAVATDFPYFQAAARVFVGLDLAARQGDVGGIQLMRDGLAGYQAAGGQTSRPRFRAQMAEQLGRVGRVGEGLASILEEIEASRSARFYLAELYRIQGELLLLHGGDENVRVGERCFLQAIDVARAQQARSFELRAVLSLCQCCRRYSAGTTGESVRLLVDLYSTFSEGLETGDLKEAGVFLREARAI